jgi:hypothetical protein
MLVRSADDLEFDFLFCPACDHKWVVRKISTSPSSV